jgi:hypothetical protein
MSELCTHCQSRSNERFWYKTLNRSSHECGLPFLFSKNAQDTEVSNCCATTLTPLCQSRERFCVRARTQTATINTTASFEDTQFLSQVISNLLDVSRTKPTRQPDIMSSALVSMSGSLFQSLYVMIMGEPRTGRHGRINRHRRKGLVGTLSSIVNYGKKKKVRVTNGTVRRVAKKATPRTPASKKPSPAPPSQSLMDELACLKGELAFLGLDSAPVKSSTAKDKDVIKSPAGLGKPPPSPNSTRKSAAPKVAPKPPAASGAVSQLSLSHTRVFRWL